MEPICPFGKWTLHIRGKFKLKEIPVRGWDKTPSEHNRSEELTALEVGVLLQNSRVRSWRLSLMVENRPITKGPGFV